MDKRRIAATRKDGLSMYCLERRQVSRSKIPHLGWLLAFFALGLFPGSVHSAEDSGYGFPLTNPYAATIIGTPESDRADLPELPTREVELTIFPEREVPTIFWYNKRLKVGVALQKERRAPLVFVIAGTGAGHSTPTGVLLQKILYAAGFHVISVPSPTHPNFITAASTSQVPGYTESDVEDLYRAMALAYASVASDIEADAIYLSGYSLGAFHSAFLSQLDREQQVFKFKKVLMLNPPVSLYRSSLKLDQMLEANIPGGMDHMDAFMEEVFQAFAEVYGDSPVNVTFGGEFLYEVYKRRNPADAKMRALIGAAFRLSAADMAFVSDVSTQAGYVVPKGSHLRIIDPLADYFKVLNRLGFDPYVNGLFFPYYHRKTGKSKTEIMEKQSLRAIGDYLRSAKNIYLLHNEDDIIMEDGDIDYLKALFGKRALIYPYGGHCGNINYSQTVQDIHRILKSGE